MINLAIDGETTESFSTGSGRVPPVVGRTDTILASENANYAPNALVSQETRFFTAVADQIAAGNPVGTVSISLGFNDLSTAVGRPLSDVPGILAAYQSDYGFILSEIRQTLPNARLLVLGYYNPFAADPTNPAAPAFNAYGMQLNATIKDLATQYNGIFVDTTSPFVGNEAALTYLARMPHDSSSPPSGPYRGIEPIGNVHPNDAGYAAIASQVQAVPEPASVALLALGCGGLFVVRRRRARTTLVG